MGRLYDGSERNRRLEALFFAQETDYGDGATVAPVAALLAQNVKVTPINGELVKRQFVQPYLGARPGVRVGQHMMIEFEIEAAGSGVAGTPPVYDAVLRSGGLARTVISGLATLPAAATIGAGAVGRFAFAKTAKYAGTYGRVVTLTCTTGGGSGVAEFTVSSPATPQDAAVSVAAQVMTTAAPFGLIQGAVITPSAVSVDFEVGDTYTLALTPERVSYTPVSSGFESAVIYYEQDGVLHRGYGARSRIGLKIAKRGFPIFNVKTACLALPVTADALAGADYSGFRDPVVAAAANIPVCRVDGFDAIFHDFSLDTGNDAKYADAANAEGIKIGARETQVSITIDEPALADKNFYVLAAPAGGVLPTGAFWLRHGTEAGATIDVAAPNLQFDQVNPGGGGEDEPPQLSLTCSALPTRGLGNDEFTISIQ